MATDILKKIIARKREEITDARRERSESSLRDQAAAARSGHPFKEALRKPGKSGINIIAEIKRASPSKGIIRADLDAETYARAYETGGAAAISVLTDTPFFKGSFEDFRAARNAVRLPLLRKDFIIEPYQIFESVVLGADAILLIVRVLSAGQLKELLALCIELNIDALVEVHSPGDLETATEAGAALIGINNRNLQSFDTDTGNARRMAAQLENWQVGIAASGIQNREDIQRTKAAGIHNFLIGESIVRAADPAAFLHALHGDGKEAE